MVQIVKEKLTLAKTELQSNVVDDKGKELKEADYQIVGYSPDGKIYFKTDKDLSGAAAKSIRKKIFLIIEWAIMNLNQITLK